MQTRARSQTLISNGKPNSFDGKTKVRSSNSRGRKKVNKKRNKEQKHFYVYYTQPLHIVWIAEMLDCARTDWAQGIVAITMKIKECCVLHWRLHVKIERKKWLINSDWAAKLNVHTQSTGDKVWNRPFKMSVISMQNLSSQSLARSAHQLVLCLCAMWRATFSKRLPVNLNVQNRPSQFAGLRSIWTSPSSSSSSSISTAARKMKTKLVCVFFSFHL